MNSNEFNNAACIRHVHYTIKCSHHSSLKVLLFLSSFFSANTNIFRESQKNTAATASRWRFRNHGHQEEMTAGHLKRCFWLANFNHMTTLFRFRLDYFWIGKYFDQNGQINSLILHTFCPQAYLFWKHLVIHCHQRVVIQWEPGKLSNKTCLVDLILSLLQQNCNVVQNSTPTIYW